jgi:N-acetylneuraminic acid mutarotase
MQTKRSALAAVTAPDGRVFAIGGWNGGGVLGSTYASVEIYSPATNRWTQGAPLSIARDAHAAAVDADHIYVVGGATGNDMPPIASLEIYDFDTGTWHAGAPMPTARQGLCAIAAPNGKIYAIGGGNNGYGGTYIQYTTVEAYTPSTNTWAAVAPLPSATANLACALGGDGRIYAIGGGYNNIGEQDARVYAYNVGTNTWAAVASLPVGRAQHAAVTSSDGKIVVVGGLTSSMYSTIVSEYDPSTNKWSLHSGILPGRVRPAAARAGDNRLYVIGGYGGYTDGALATTGVYVLGEGWIP